MLRHTFATRLREQGVSDGTIQALGRWKEPKMIRRYAHVNDEMMKKAPGTDCGELLCDYHYTPGEANR